MRYVLFTMRDGRISGFKLASEVVLYNIEENKPEKSIRNTGIETLEELIEEYDTWLLFTREISGEDKELVEEMGVKVVVTSLETIDEVIGEFFTG
ncbi:hypothetical protein DKAM_1059 [Desulfurococcus amylolyticus 1221n]|uniref:Dinitrogenase iron-molybdenum cofactor biosynthesis domain-containing protein n=1 Tax=Desulfurococcus amylolyticus (strain DSM 18924 / JCM 16383 / VKM B-2413 / 1221n) TaxID=490899 RepID=B8D5K4_DESA1|nr:hypothetical protein [Desulfurococcus amylolyticus]ACL11385.1 hypothetical protein DKAM_1059 [Desulfurococcus amylolyticus 1221n]